MHLTSRRSARATGRAPTAAAAGRDHRASAPPDVALCGACEAELRDPSDRRYAYPFITCAECGPRYTVTERLPFGRDRTSMHAFRMCDECAREYDTPGDRRFRSETNSCPECGPSVWLASRSGATLARAGEAVAEAGSLLASGRIVAVRDTGGFHLVVDAADDAAVRRLREREGREGEPFAVMVRDAGEAAKLARVSPAERDLLSSDRRPIVILARLPGSGLSSSIAPGLDTIGLLMAYTPLQHLLLEAAGRPLVATSGSPSDAPLAAGNEEALQRLGRVADAFLLHDLEIAARCHDSVVRDAAGSAILMRRARGWAPQPVPIPVASPRPLLAVGAELRNSLALARARRAYPSPFIGDVGEVETIAHWLDTLDHYRELFGIEPEAVVRDAHGGYPSTRLAGELGLELLPAVDHHHAHVAAVAAEHGVTGPVIGVAYDGAGRGADGTPLGAEVVVADLISCRRVAHLRPAPFPVTGRTAGRAAPGQVSSMGRLFDAAAAVLGVRHVSRYEAEAALALESLVAGRPGELLPFPRSRREGEDWVLDPLPLLEELGRRKDAGVDVGRLAAAFHETIAEATADLVGAVSDEERLHTVALGGGVFQNARLLVAIAYRLRSRGMRVLTPVELPPNDGAIAYGQAAVAAARMARTQEV